VIGPDDIAIERRALADLVPALPAALIGASVTGAIAAGAPIAARDVVLAPPLPRGTQVEVDLRRGAVHIRGIGTLEVAARPGAPASARLAATKIIVHGTLVAPSTLVWETCHDPPPGLRSGLHRPRPRRRARGGLRQPHRAVTTPSTARSTPASSARAPGPPAGASTPRARPAWSRTRARAGSATSW